MLVGEAPGANEDKAGRPFVGEAGEKLNEALARAGIDRRSVYITNTAKCRPPGNRTPERTESEACIGYLIEEIESVQPKIIVALGGPALKTLTGNDKVGVNRGKVIPPRKGLITSAKIMTSYHPAASLYARGPGAFENLVEDLKAIKASFEPAVVRETLGDVFTFPPGSSDADVLTRLKPLTTEPFLSVDLEWTALKNKGNKTTMIWPWSNRGEVYSISFTGMVNLEYYSVCIAWPDVSPRVRTAVHWLLKNIPCVFHNAMADGLWLNGEGMGDFNLGWDTYVLAYLIDETQPHGLQPVATKYAPEIQPGWKGHLHYERPKTPEDWKDILDYNADDTVATHGALRGLNEAINALPPKRRDQILRLHRHLLIPALRVLQRAGYLGVPINRERMAVQLEEARTRQLEAAEELAGLIGSTVPSALNMARSDDQVAAYIKGSLGLDLEDTRKDTLKELQQYPSIVAIGKIRKETKNIGTYFEPWTRMFDRQRTNRLHSIYNLAKVRTGRLTAETEEGASLIVTPREKKFRTLVEADDGYLILAGDYKTVEMRVAAVESNEQMMLEFFRQDIDLHVATAAYITACGVLGNPPSIGEWWADRQRWMAPIEKEYKETGFSQPRQDAKGANFGFVYGMMPEKFQDFARTQYSVYLTLEQAKIMYRGYHALYSGLKPWHERSMASATSLGYIETFWGRRRKFEEGDVHAAINSPIQSAAHDFTMRAMPAVVKSYRENGIDAEIIGEIHDSIMVHVKEEHADLARRILVYEMQNVDTTPFGFKFPIDLPADTKLGKTWG